MKNALTFFAFALLCSGCSFGLDFDDLESCTESWQAIDPDTGNCVCANGLGESTGSANFSAPGYEDCGIELTLSKLEGTDLHRTIDFAVKELPEGGDLIGVLQRSEKKLYYLGFENISKTNESRETGSNFKLLQDYVEHFEFFPDLRMVTGLQLVNSHFGDLGLSPFLVREGQEKQYYWEDEILTAIFGPTSENGHAKPFMSVSQVDVGDLDGDGFLSSYALYSTFWEEGGQEIRSQIGAIPLSYEFAFLAEDSATTCLVHSDCPSGYICDGGFGTCSPSFSDMSQREDAEMTIESMLIVPREATKTEEQDQSADFVAAADFVMVSCTEADCIDSTMPAILNTSLLSVGGFLEIFSLESQQLQPSQIKELDSYRERAAESWNASELSEQPISEEDILFKSVTLTSKTEHHYSFLVPHLKKAGTSNFLDEYYKATPLPTGPSLIATWTNSWGAQLLAFTEVGGNATLLNVKAFKNNALGLKNILVALAVRDSNLILAFLNPLDENDQEPLFEHIVEEGWALTPIQDLELPALEVTGDHILVDSSRGVLVFTLSKRAE